MNLAFALEYSLGHVTHAQNLKRILEDDRDVTPIYIDLPYHDTPGWWTKLPFIKSNWSARASLGALLGLRPHIGKIDAILFHTQVTSLFSESLMRRAPSVVSLDATPLQYDALGAFYGHVPSGNTRVEALKKQLNERAFHAAKALVTWSEWAKQSLVDDYGVPANKVTVIPPGIDTARWDFPKRASVEGRPINLLFVGGDFPRKGGDTLLEAFKRLPAEVNARLKIVTITEGVGDGVDGVDVYRGVKPNTPELLERFAEADLFVFPSRGDCLPLAVMEALAAGLPVIATDVGALSEAVRHGETGLIVPMDDADALAAAITELATDHEKRAAMSVRARESALARFDAATNYRKLVDVVKGVARKAA
ncbi:MAG: glycosyl transferase group 1 [Capsulimonas sp.]|jgi:glycosyltransferase involved in cell wall biosynthesis|nr:glycosyl transferase group 1 [Capsulimonas sp.]